MTKKELALEYHKKDTTARRQWHVHFVRNSG